MNDPRLPNTAAWKDPFRSVIAPSELSSAGRDHHTSEATTGKDAAGDQPPRSGSFPTEYAPGPRRSLDGSDVDGSTPHNPPLLSREAEKAVGGAFGGLIQTIITQNIQVLDAHMTSVVRAHLQEWLNSNLPILAERLVRLEIERVARTR